MVIPFAAITKPAIIPPKQIITKPRRLALWRFPGEKQELGRLTVFDGPHALMDCVTLQRAIGVPDGTYPVTLYLSPKSGKLVLLLHEILGHEFIEVHIGNTLSDTAGCILPGKEFADIDHNGLLDVNFSAATMGRLLALITQPTKITICTLYE